MKNAIPARLAKYALSIAIPLAAGAYLLSTSAKTEKPTNVPMKDKVARIPTEMAPPTITRRSPGPINNPRNKNSRPRPTDNKYHNSKPRPRPGRPIKNKTKEVPAG